ncbi:MAG TPA: hypothetical protein VFS44_08605 [Gemmatimonadaceae bacterium]|nr:hypothetical protein [Gemmatimonadaceae bacterium]
MHVMVIRPGPTVRHLTGVVLVGLVLSSAAAAQGHTARARSSAPIVDRIEIDRESVFDSSETTAWYARLANALHVTTRRSVVERELLFHAGEPFDSARVAESARNLRRLGIFRAVRVDTVETDSGIVARVVTRDAWTTRAYFSLSGSGGQVAYGLGLKESNLLGRFIQLRATYRKEPDRSTLQFSYDQPRLLASRIGLTTLYEHLSDGRHAGASLSWPFFSLSSTGAASVGGEWFDGRVLRYFGGERVASDSVQRRFAIGRLGVARALRADERGYLRVGLEAQLRREDYVPESFTGVIPRTITGAVVLYAEASRARFAIVRNFRSLSPDEDVDLSSTVRVGVGVAPAAWGYERTGVGPQLAAHTGVRFPGGFAILDAAATPLFGSAGLDSGTFTAAGTAVLQPTARQSAVVHLDVGREVNPAPGAEFDLGLERGPRAFPAHAFTGDRSFFTMAEYRWIAVPDLAGLGSIGLAAFADYGGAWYGGSPWRTGKDFGVGLRLGSHRISSVRSAARIDIARRVGNGVERGSWVLVVGSGFPFEALQP